MRIFSGLILGAALAGPLAAQEQCAHRHLIVGMADDVITSDSQSALASFYVSRAAYLKMHYADLAGEEIETLLDDIDREGQGDLQLRATYALSQDGGLARWRIATDDILEEFRSASPSLLRALILADGGDTFFRLRAAAMPDEPPQMEPFFAGPRPALVLSDQPDAFRVAFSGKAEASGAIWLAGAVIVGHSEPDLFDAYLKRHAAVFDEVRGEVRWRFAPYSDHVRDELIAQRSAIEGEYSGTLANEYTVQAAALATYPISFLGIYHAQSGARDTTYPAAQAVLDTVALGQVDPLRDPDQIWHLTYTQLLMDADPADVRAVLSGFDFGNGRYWHAQQDALWQLDQLVATSALLPYSRGETDMPPDAPDATVIDWAAWVTVADHLQGDKLLAAFAVDPVASIELLWAQEKYAVAWGLSRAHEDQVKLDKLLIDLATRLDMLCDQRTILSTLSGRWGREEMFHFP